MVASVQVIALALYQTLAPWQFPEGLRSICDIAQKKVLCFPLTALPRAGGTLATAHAIDGEEQKALSQVRPCSMLSLPMSPAAPFCVCPGPHLEAAQTNQTKPWMPQARFQASLTSVVPEEEHTLVLTVSILGVHRSGTVMLSAGILILPGFYSAFHRSMAVSPSIFWKLFCRETRLSTFVPGHSVAELAENL